MYVGWMSALKVDRDMDLRECYAKLSRSHVGRSRQRLCVIRLNST